MRRKNSYLITLLALILSSSTLSFSQEKETLALTDLSKEQKVMAELYDTSQDWLSLDVDSAEVYADRLLQMSLLNGKSKWAGKGYKLLGRIEQERGNLSHALDMYMNGVRHLENVGDQKEKHRVYCLLGGLYLESGEYEEAKMWLLDCVEHFDQTNNYQAQAESLLLLAECDFQIGHIEASIQSLERVDYLIKEHRLDIITLALKAEIYEELKEYSYAKKSYEQLLKIGDKRNDEKMVLQACFGLVGVAKMQNNHDSTLMYLEKAREWAEHFGDKKGLLMYHELIAETFVEKNNYYRAYLALGEYNKIKEELDKEENLKKYRELQVKFETKEKEKKLSEQSVMLKESEELKNRQKIFFITILVFVITVLLFVVFRSRNRKRVNRILHKKNSEIESHRRKVMDSIKYARTIQDSFLNKKEVLSRNFPFSSVYYNAKDVVSGDLFWVGEKHGKKIIAAIDCTGHGVPGAFMSLIAHECLKKTIEKAKSLDPADLLLSLHRLVVETLGGHLDEGFSKEGMDMSLCVVDELSREILFAGAKNSILIKHKNELIELKGDPVSIGGLYSKVLKFNSQPFSTKKYAYQEGSEIFMFTDGILDQFGGEEGKKLNKSGFKKLIAAYNGRIEVMDHYVQDFMEKWMGDREQLDDMLLLSLKI